MAPEPLVLFSGVGGGCYSVCVCGGGVLSELCVGLLLATHAYK